MPEENISLFGAAAGPTPTKAPATEQNNSVEADEPKPGEPRFAPVPPNNLDTDNRLLLQMSEDVAGGVRAHELRIGDAYIPGKFDSAHFRDLHAYLMQDIYPEPGATRNDELLLAKHALKDTPDAELPKQYDSRLGASGQAITLLSAEKVNDRLDELSGKLGRENNLGGLDKPEFVARLADYHLQYRKASPFQAGNEHVLGAVLNQIGIEAGYEVKPHMAKNLREVTDATLEAGVDSSKSRLIQVLSSITEPGTSREATLRRDPTQWALPVKDSPEAIKRQKEEDMGQAGAKLAGRVGGVEGVAFRASMRAIIAGDPSPESINVARSTALKYAGPDLRADADRIVSGATYLDSYRRGEQQQGRENDMGRAIPREPERGNRAEIVR